MRLEKIAMQIFNSPTKSPQPPLHKGGNIILALGAESAGNFSIFHEKNIYFSDDFGDLLDDKNFKKFQKSVLDFLKKNKIKPDIILTDLHPLYKTTRWGAELAKKYKAKHVQIQHHLAHIFSAIGEKQIIENCLPATLSLARQAGKLKIENCLGVALDGTGYGLDEKIWGGEVFKVKSQKSKVKSIERIGHLENQTMVGGDLAVKEPARMLISILNKFSILNFKFSNKSQFSIFKTKKDFIYNFVKKHYTRNQFELLYNQLQNNFNCVETSSAGRVLDAVSVLLGFCENKRNYKHEPIDLLEKSSTLPYNNLKPKINSYYNKESRIMNYELCTTYLFEYLIKNSCKNKHRLATTAQLYIAQGLHKIIKKNIHNTKYIIHNTFLAGGISNNKIISSYLESKGTYKNKTIPRSDAGISFGQIIYYLNIKK